jgi:hypothetical protein
MSTGAWFHGISHGTGVENAYSRAAQYAAAADPKFCAKFIIPLLHAKATNQRALILRNGSGPKKETATRALAEHLRALDPSTATINARSSSARIPQRKSPSFLAQVPQLRKTFR